MRIAEITTANETADPFKAQMDAAKRQQKELKVKKARIRMDRAQAAYRKAQQS